MVIILDGLSIKLKNLVDGKSANCLLDSGALYNFFSVNWCDHNGLKYEWGKWFSIQLADGKEVPTAVKLHCLVDLGLIKTALTLYILDYNILCI